MPISNLSEIPETIEQHGTEFTFVAASFGKQQFERGGAKLKDSGMIEDYRVIEYELTNGCPLYAFYVLGRVRFD